MGSPKGFILNIVQVPGIKFGTYDRDYTEYEHTFIRGKRKGETEMRKEYTGEPTFENYLARCKEWYDSKGSEAARSFAIQYNEPLVPRELEDVLLYVDNCNNRVPTPENFRRDLTQGHCKAYERVCDYYPLCNTSTDAWSTIIENEYVQIERT